jgi:uncharacterized protein with PIN domain
VSRVRPPALAEPRFLLDTHLGKLAAHLRLLGFDTAYTNDASDPELARRSRAEGRILLTRDRGLLKRSSVVHGYHVWETDPERQVVEVVQRFALLDKARPFSRCTRCNGRVEPVAKAQVLDALEPKTRLYYDEFGRCQGCGRVYWKGSHYERIQGLLERFGTRP